MTDKTQTVEYDEAHLPVHAGNVRVQRNEDGQYIAHWDGHSAAVRVCRAFPWSEPDLYVSLRDHRDREITLVASLDDLDAESQAAVTAALAETSFVLEVTRLEDISEEYEIRNWKVLTRQGPRTFQTRRDEWPRRLGHGGLLIRDVSGDLFHIAEPDRLDPASLKRLRAYID